MSSNAVADYCSTLPVFEVALPEGDNKASYDLVLKPVPADDGVDQYWPLYHEADEGEQFGNMLFKFNGKNGKFTLNISLDLSEVAGAKFVDNSGNLDGIVGLSPNFKHEFKSKVVSGSNGTQLEITIKNKDKKKDPDPSKDAFSFLWLCESATIGGQFKSGDPEAHIEPQ
ncbi:hypothetical protein [Microbulbifer magnicolonia]|uniref:hypothetical protein n=1 Tax=Microbulbifer magnicolonia TaxID=3109744 RepID=UPI002B40B856|nr:hypothetical protein [Microbulbifer sp. GG15]